MPSSSRPSPLTKVFAWLTVKQPRPSCLAAWTEVQIKELRTSLTCSVPLSIFNLFFLVLLLCFYHLSLFLPQHPLWFVASKSLPLLWLALCVGALAAILLSAPMDRVSFVVLLWSQSGAHTHTRTPKQTPTNRVNPAAGLSCHTGGCCVIGWICFPARYRASPLKFHLTCGNVNKPWDY